MKKLWWLLPVALLAAGSLVFLGCPNGGGGGGGGGDDDDDYDWVELTIVQTGLGELGLKDDDGENVTAIADDEKASGKGYVIGDDLELVMDAEAGSLIRVTLTGTENLNWGSIGAIGLGSMADSEGKRCDFAPNKAGGTYTADVKIADFLALDPIDTDEAMHVNVWGGHKIDKVELGTPKGEYVPPPPTPEWPADYDEGDVLTLGTNPDYTEGGPRFIVGDEFAKFKTAADRNNEWDVLVITVDVTNGEHKVNASWGLGKVNDELEMTYGAVGDDNLSTNIFFIADIVETLEYENFDINVWDSCVTADIKKVQIWTLKD